MQIDWFTIIAQAINFLILVWMMKRFLYKPILNAIAEREKKIATELANADKKKKEAESEHGEWEKKNKEFDEQKATLLSKATVEVEAERERLLNEAKKTASDLNVKWQEALKSEKQNLNQSIRRRTQQEVFAICRKALTDLAGASLEDRMLHIFVQKLHEISAQTKENLGKALKKESSSLLRSAFDLSMEQSAAIQKALNETFSADIQLRFEIAPDLISGIELTTNGQKLAWSISDYLVSMEKGIEEILKEKKKIEVKAKPVAKTEPKPEEPKPLPVSP